MHFVILVEDESGKKFLDVILPKIINPKHSFKFVPYKGIGRIPRKGDLVSVTTASDKLLNDLPLILAAYGKNKLWKTGENNGAVIVVCDLDNKCLKQFRKELLSVLNECNPPPETRFCIAVEEMEAWLLGDTVAIKKAFPKTKNAVLDAYTNDSICDTWEKLADAVYQGGSNALKPLGYQAIGFEKSKWAEKITSHMNIDQNKSPSFNYFVRKIREITSNATGIN